MSKLTTPVPNPQPKAKSKTGSVLGFLRRKKKDSSTPQVTSPQVINPPQQTPPPQTAPPQQTQPQNQPPPKSKITIGTNRGQQQQEQQQPTGPDPFQTIKTRIAETRKQLISLTTYSFTPPKVVNDNLQASDDIVKKATQPEQFGEALKLLNDGLVFAEPMKGYAEDRRAALSAIGDVKKLPFVTHAALLPSAAHIDKCLKVADEKLVSATTLQATELPRQLLQGLVATMLPEITDNSNKMVTADMAIKEAEASLAELADYKFLDLSDANQKITGARSAFNNAQTVTEATAAVDQLNGLKDDLKSAKNNAKDELKAVEEYYSKRRELMNKVAEASKLRGADTAPAMIKLISGAKEQVAFADSLVLGATTKGELETAKKMLSAESEVLSKCEKLAKEQKEKAEAELKAIPKYEQAYLQLREARADIATLPGATAQLQECDKLLAAYRITTSGEPASGYVDALKALEGKGAELLKLAQQKSQTFTTSEMDPDVQDELEKANGKLEVYAKNLPTYRTEGRKLAVAAAASEPDKGTAIRKLQELMNSMDQEILAANQLRSEAMQSTKATFAVIQQLKEKNAPQVAYEALEKVYNERVLPAMGSREFDVAIPLLTSIEKDAKTFLSSFEKDFEEWSKAKQRLLEIEAHCLRLMNWPPLGGGAMNLRNSVLELIAQTEKDLTFAKGAAGLTAIENRLVNLNEAAKEQNLSDESRIDDFARFRTNRREGIENEKIAAEKELLILEQKLASAGIKSVKSTAAHKLVAETYANWLKAIDHPALKQGEDPKKVLADHYTIAYNEMRRAAQLAKDIAADDSQFQAAVTEGKRSDARGKFREVFEDIQRMLNELEALGVNVSKDRALLPAKLEDSAITTELGGTLMQLHKGVKFSYEQALSKLQERKTVSREQLKGLQKTLKKHADKEYQFEDYWNELTAQIEDAEAMLESNDPTLVAAAEKEIATLTQALDDTTPDKNDPNKKTFKDVIELWKHISSVLGKDEKMKKRMNFTYNRLRDKLNQTITEAKKQPPSDALENLTKVGDEIEKAYQAALVQDEMYKRFEAKFKVIRTDLLRSPVDIVKKPGEFVEDVKRTDKITEVKKRTATRITEKTTAYWDKIDSALAEAEELAKTEGHIHEAFEKLADIEKELDDILALSPDEARVALQEKDSQASQEQRVLRDMCRQWESEVDFFMKKVLPETEKAMSKSSTADKSQIEDLKKAVEWASKTLEPYLYVISSLPHRSCSANKSPDMQKATTAFGQARKKLEDLVRTARRLAGNPEGTNIEFEGNLKKVNEEWADRAQRLATALDTLAREIEAVPGQSDSDQNKPETYLAPEDKQSLLGTAPKLAKSLRDLATRIKPTAFDKPMSVLTDKKATSAQKLTAREEALRIMRLVKADVVENEMLQAIFRTKDFPFRAVNAEVGLVRAGLKKIEIEVLVGV